MHGEIDIGQPRRPWIVENDDVDLVTAPRESPAKCQHSRRNAAHARVERLHHLQNVQRARQRSLPFAENIGTREKGSGGGAPARRRRADAFR